MRKGVIIWLHRKGMGIKRPAPLFLKCRAKCWSIIGYLLFKLPPVYFLSKRWSYLIIAKRSIFLIFHCLTLSIKIFIKKILFANQKALRLAFNTIFIIKKNFTTNIQKFKELFCSQNLGFKTSFKDFWYTKIYQTQIW